MKYRPTSPRKILILIGLLVGTLSLFQNCGDVRLAKTPQPSKASPESVASLKLTFCSDNTDNMGWQILSFGMVNINAIAKQAKIVPDSDADGIPDSEDPNPTDPRKNGVLQAICSVTNSCTATCAPSSYVVPFLTSCDRLSFTDISGQPSTFDSDHDGIPDFLEILRGSDPQRSPEGVAAPDLDTDMDGRSLLQEIVDQTDPNWPDTTVTAARFQPQMKRLANTTDCPSPRRLYEISVADEPWVKVEPFVDPLTFSVGGHSFNLSHTADENIVFSYIILKGDIPDPQNGPKYRALMNLRRIKIDDASGEIQQSDLTEVEKWP